ncbi:MAG: diguanylate cyclase [Clostridia bacterium]|nr:diguanylate cyclase [Clostridia bacterium]
MKELSDAKNRRDFTKESIIGLGEASFRKNYYSELQDKLLDLERINTRNRALIATIPDFLLVSTDAGEIKLFGDSNKRQSFIINGILENNEIMNEIKGFVKRVSDSREMVSYNFSYCMYDFVYYFEARVNISEFNEILIIIRDMTERMLMEMKLREMAEQDGLTKLYNRHCFMEKLNQYDGKHVEDFALLVIDIDGLKLVNDTLGHSYGDSIIMAIANILSTLFLNRGFVSRVGGDEFGIVLVGHHQEEIENLLVQMGKMLEDYNERSDIFKISVSSGYSFNSGGIIRTNAMYQEADNNMYQNKMLKESSNRNSLVKTLMKALEVKDFITEGHADRLEEFSLKMAKKLRLSQHQVDRMKLLAKFHDIGKVGIPDKILLKPENLTSDEWIVMKTHSNIGKRIAEASPELREISSLILFHHERFDGKGYPLGLKEMEIPIECRILSIVDTFDAMTNDRPYRKALPKQAAIQEIKDCGGTQFDPDLVEVFLDISSGSTGNPSEKS